jgi:hypothetical protein
MSKEWGRKGERRRGRPVARERRDESDNIRKRKKRDQRKRRGGGWDG